MYSVQPINERATEYNKFNSSYNDSNSQVSFKRIADDEKTPDRLSDSGSQTFEASEKRYKKTFNYESQSQFLVSKSLNIKDKDGQNLLIPALTPVSNRN